MNELLCCAIILCFSYNFSNPQFVQWSTQQHNLLNKHDKGEANSGLDSSIPFPPGFTPEREFQHVDAQEGQGMENSLSKRRSEGLSSRVLEDAQPLNEHASPSIDSKKKQVARYWRSSRWFQMNCLSLNVQGLGSKAKKDWIKELNNKHKVNFLSVQETKLDCISDMDVKVLWGNYKFEYTISEAVGNSGGILCVWDPSVFRKEHHVVSDNFVALYGSWVSNQASLLVVSIYAPQCMEDRLGSVYNAQGANEFNSFISNSGLVEIQLEGYSFTWSLQSAKKMSKLDRFFVSDGLLSLFPHLSGICLDRHLSDHRPILLREVVTDYGPSPFRVYHSWFSLQGFDQMVLETWNNIDLDDKNKMVRFKKKLQILKKEIRSWVNDCKKNQSGRLVDLRSKLCHIDKSSDARDYMQKAKIQWAIEGDENSKFFHGIINRKRANLAIKGVMVDGEWVDDPYRVKEEFRLHFANRFRAPAANRCKLNYIFPNRLSSDQLDMLESPISRDKVRNAV
ncbi:RNA-directed DNA polymerase, eukaryota [Tanacetum coccineum]